MRTLILDIKAEFYSVDYSIPESPYLFELIYSVYMNIRCRIDVLYFPIILAECRLSQLGILL